MIRKALAITTLFILAAALPALAIQNEDIHDGYYTVVWELPDGGDYPQTLVDYVYTAEVRDLDLLDGQLDECKGYQIDVYRINSDKDAERLASLLNKGTLEKGEDNKIWHSSKRVDPFTSCTPEETTTTTESSTTTVTSTTSTSTTSSSTTSTTLVTSSTEPESKSSTTVSTPQEELPFTGNDTVAMVLSALAFLGLGKLALWKAERV